MAPEEWQDIETLMPTCGAWCFGACCSFIYFSWDLFGAHEDDEGIQSAEVLGTLRGAAHEVLGSCSHISGARFMGSLGEKNRWLDDEEGFLLTKSLW